MSIVRTSANPTDRTGIDLAIEIATNGFVVDNQPAKSPSSVRARQRGGRRRPADPTQTQEQEKKHKSHSAPPISFMPESSSSLPPVVLMTISAFPSTHPTHRLIWPRPLGWPEVARGRHEAVASAQALAPPREQFGEGKTDDRTEDEAGHL
jgi:hypothetical protein